MALNCEDTLAEDIQKDCDNKPKGGIEVNVVLINRTDIDYATSTLDPTNDLILTKLQLLSGKSGFVIEGIKQVQGAAFEGVIKESNFDAFKHTFSGVLLNPSAANKKSLSAILSGSSYVAVIEKKWKGADSLDAFEVLGFDSGLVNASSAWNTKEDDGVIKFDIASQDGYEEPKMPLNLLETDYATTKTAFDNVFIAI